MIEGQFVGQLFFVGKDNFPQWWQVFMFWGPVKLLQIIFTMTSVHVCGLYMFVSAKLRLPENMICFGLLVQNLQNTLLQSWLLWRDFLKRLARVRYQLTYSCRDSINAYRCNVRVWKVLKKHVTLQSHRTNNIFSVVFIRRTPLLLSYDIKKVI